MYSSYNPGRKSISQGSLLCPRLKNKVSLTWDPGPFSPCKFLNKSRLKDWHFALREKIVSALKKKKTRWGKICGVLKDNLKTNIPIALETKH
jgi:hypothetical protein